MRSVLRFVLAASVFACVTAAIAADLGPGSKAPAMGVKTWFKGKHVTAFNPKKIYVVEFWATWCGPCRESIPHLTELAKKNKDVTFVGVSIWEDDKGGNIKKFVSDMGAKMDYNVGYSGNKTGMAETWMKAAGQNGIPTAFVVKGGKVLWIGHPMELEKPLGEIKSGKFNLEAFKKTYKEQAVAAAVEMGNRREADTISKLIQGGKTEEAAKRIDALEKKGPETRVSVNELRFSLLAKTNPDQWEAKAKELGASPKEEDHDLLCSYAFGQVTGAGGDVEKGRRAIELALANAKEGDMMLYYNGATFYEIVKEPKKALELMDKAIAAWPKSSMKDNKSVGEALTRMRGDFAKKVKD